MPLPDEVRHLLADLHLALDPSREMPVRWVEEARIHLTLAFLGDVPLGWIPNVRDALTRACADRRAISLSLGTLSAFPSAQRPRVIWIGLEGELDALRGLQHDIARELRSIEVPFDDRPFEPHLTLGRLRHEAPRSPPGRLADVLGQPTPVPETRFVADRVEFVASHLGETPARYETLASVVLHDAEPSAS